MCGCFLGKKTFEDASNNFWNFMIDVCSGALTWGEIYNDSSEVFLELIGVYNGKLDFDAIILKFK